MDPSGILSERRYSSVQGRTEVWLLSGHTSRARAAVALRSSRPLAAARVREVCRLAGHTSRTALSSSACLAWCAEQLHTSRVQLPWAYGGHHTRTHPRDCAATRSGTLLLCYRTVPLLGVRMCVRVRTSEPYRTYSGTTTTTPREPTTFPLFLDPASQLNVRYSTSPLNHATIYVVEQRTNVIGLVKRIQSSFRRLNPLD